MIKTWLGIIGCVLCGFMVFGGGSGPASAKDVGALGCILIAMLTWTKGRDE